MRFWLSEIICVQDLIQYPELIHFSVWPLSSLPLYAQGVTIQYLSLGPDTFDDAYVGCSEEMEEKAVLLLEKEMADHIYEEPAQEFPPMTKVMRRGLIMQRRVRTLVPPPPGSA